MVTARFLVRIRPTYGLVLQLCLGLEIRLCLGVRLGLALGLGLGLGLDLGLTNIIKEMFSSSIHLLVNDRISFFFEAE
jgi:hypothetical protein